MMHRIICDYCGWKTKPHYSLIDCVKEKEWAHRYGVKEKDYDAHDSAFGSICPRCGRQTRNESRYFTEQEIKEARKDEFRRKKIP